MMEDKNILSEINKLQQSKYTPVANWVTYNSRLHGGFVNQETKSKYSFFYLENGEFPIFESLLDNGNYLLITTRRVYSIFNAQQNVINILEIDDVDPDCGKNFVLKDQPAQVITKFTIQNSDKVLEYETDSGHPAIIAYMLIIDLYKIISLQNKTQSA